MKTVYNFKDKYDNKYKLYINKYEDINKYIDLLLNDTPHTDKNYLNNIITKIKFNKTSKCLFLYKNNKLVSFIFGHYTTSIYGIRLVWYDNIFNITLLFSLLPFIFTNINRILIIMPFNTSKWYKFDNLFNNNNNNKNITNLWINKKTITNIKQFLNRYNIIGDIDVL